MYTTPRHVAPRRATPRYSGIPAPLPPAPLPVLPCCSSAILLPAPPSYTGAWTSRVASPSTRPTTATRHGACLTASSASSTQPTSCLSGCSPRHASPRRPTTFLPRRVKASLQVCCCVCHGGTAGRGRPASVHVAVQCCAAAQVHLVACAYPISAADASAEYCEGGRLSLC